MLYLVVLSGATFILQDKSCVTNVNKKHMKILQGSSGSLFLQPLTKKGVSSSQNSLKIKRKLRK